MQTSVAASLAGRWGWGARTTFTPADTGSAQAVRLARTKSHARAAAQAHPLLGGSSCGDDGRGDRMEARVARPSAAAPHRRPGQTRSLQRDASARVGNPPWATEGAAPAARRRPRPRRACGAHQPPTGAAGGGRDHTRARGGWRPAQTAAGSTMAGAWRDRARGLPQDNLFSTAE